MVNSRYKANLPSVGLATFVKSPVCEDFGELSADIAILGVPYDASTGYRPGARFGPRELRSYSVRYSSWGGSLPAGFWHIDDQRRYLKGVRIVDCGDVDITYYDFDINRRKIAECVGAILERGALPVIIGGDHSISFPSVSAFTDYETLDIVQIDAHLDWVDEIEGVRYGSASPLRRCKEDLPNVRNIAHVGIRDIQVREDDYRDTIRSGSTVITRTEIRNEGIKSAIDRLPPLRDTYVTIDMDGFDPSIAPGVNGISHDGLLYHEVIGILRGVAKKANIVGIDLVELNPYMDVQGQTSLLASRLIMEFLGLVFAEREARAASGSREIEESSGR